MLIGFAGKMEAGKTTAAVLITSTVKSFATPLKSAACQIFGLSWGQVTDKDLKKVVVPFWGMSPRQILQRFGTDAMRREFGDVWVRRMELELESTRVNFTGACTNENYVNSLTNHVAIDDVRFDDEAELIRKLGGKIILIKRSESTTIPEAETRHASEAGLSPHLVDATIQNDGTVADLRDNVLQLIEIWRIKQLCINL